jgi:hypothetical protein
METHNSPPAPHSCPNKKRTLTVIFFFLKAVVIIGLWILLEITSPIKGYGQTTVELSNFVITLFILFLLSIFLSAHLTYAVRRGLIAAQPGSLLDRLVKFWNNLVPPYDVRPILEEPAESTSETEMQENWLKEFTPADVDEMLEFIVNQKGRGRKSYTPDDYRFHTVHDWILMQMKGTSVRLQDFLDERFGYHHDGSPKVPKDTFYGWYKKFKKMLKEYKTIKHA